MGNFESKIMIDDHVLFILTSEKMYGTVVAVRFTKAKVFYDILDDCYGKVFTNVDSCFVTLQQIKKMEKEQKETLEETCDRLFPIAALERSITKIPNPADFMKLGEDAFNKNVHEKLRETLSPTEKQMWINGYLLALTEQGYSVEDLECAWNSSDQNMRFQFSSSAYKPITFKQWLEKYEHER